MDNVIYICITDDQFQRWGSFAARLQLMELGDWFQEVGEYCLMGMFDEAYYFQAEMHSWV